MGLLQICLVALEDDIARAAAPGDELRQLRGKLGAWTGFVLFAGLLNQLAWCRSPPPRLGTVTMAHARATE